MKEESIKMKMKKKKGLARKSGLKRGEREHLRSAGKEGIGDFDCFFSDTGEGAQVAQLGGRRVFSIYKRLFINATLPSNVRSCVPYLSLFSFFKKIFWIVFLFNFIVSYFIFILWKKIISNIIYKRHRPYCWILCLYHSLFSFKKYIYIELFFV